MASSDDSDVESGTEGVPDGLSAAELAKQLAAAKEESAALRERVRELEQVLNDVLGSVQGALNPSAGGLPQKSDIKTFVEHYGDHLQCSFLHGGMAAGPLLVAERSSYNLSVHLPKGQRLRCKHKSGEAIVDNYNMLQILKQIGFAEGCVNLPFKMTLQRVLRPPAEGQPVDVGHIEGCTPGTFASKRSQPELTRLFKPADTSGKDAVKVTANLMQCYAGNNVPDYANHSAEFRFKFSKGVTSRKSNGAVFCLRACLDIDDAAWESKWANAGLVAPRIPSVTTGVFQIRTNSAEVGQKRKAPGANHASSSGGGRDGGGQSGS